MIKQNKIYFFDIDETIFNTHKFNKNAIDVIFDFIIESGVHISKPELLKFYFEVYEEIKTSPSKMAAYVLKLSQKFPKEFSGLKQIKKLENECDEKFKNFMTTNLRDFIYPRVKDTLDKLKEQGFKLGVISQGDLKIQRSKFDSLGVTDLFEKDLLFFYEKKTLEKYKIVYDKVLEKYSGFELLMVGDRENLDIIMSRDAGFSPIRIVGSGKYSKVKEFSDYESYKDFTEFYQSL
ncbi:MAG: HAD-IA family hydrolase [Nanoarchaeales archaeon]|nr:HAD-IA family hydrolase [Nanoarchaeales archaeon]